MHHTSMLLSIESYFNETPVHLAHFLSSIKVDDANQCCSRSGLIDGQDNLQTRHYFEYLMKGVLSIKRIPPFSGSGAVLPLECRGCVHSQGWRIKKEKKSRKHGGDLGVYLVLLAAQHTLSAQKSHNQGLGTRVLSSRTEGQSRIITTVLYFTMQFLVHICDHNFVAVNKKGVKTSLFDSFLPTRGVVVWLL